MDRGNNPKSEFLAGLILADMFAEFIVSVIGGLLKLGFFLVKLPYHIIVSVGILVWCAVKGIFRLLRMLFSFIFIDSKKNKEPQ